jgi:hypothetical protein
VRTRQHVDERLGTRSSIIERTFNPRVRGSIPRGPTDPEFSGCTPGYSPDMGSAMAILIWLVILAAVAWFLLGGGLAALSGTKRKTDAAGRANTLRYAVPEGQDPAAVMAVLAPAGYPTTLEEKVDTRVLVIASEDGKAPDPGAVRALIVRANTTIQDPALMTTDVRFLDEGQR